MNVLTRCAFPHSERGCNFSKTVHSSQAQRLLDGGENMRAFVRGLAIGLLPATLAGLGTPTQAGITRIEITSRVPAYGGASFGSVGQYETLRGVAFGEVDPNDPLNEVITDIKLAPRNARGMVEYNMDFWISKPVTMANANGTL